MALAGAAGAAYASTRKDTAGEIVRSAGNGAVSAYEKAKSFNEEHQITQKAGEAARASFAKAKELNEKYQITTRSKEAIENSYNAAVEYNKKHSITQRMGESISRGLDMFTSSLGSSASSTSQAAAPPDVPDREATAPPAPTPIGKY